MPTLKQRLAAGETTRVFALARLAHPLVVEMVGLVGGFHGFWLDSEHGGLTSEQIMVTALSGRANGLDAFVRMAPTGYAAVTQVLEAGATGVMAAQIHSADEARRFVSWAKFPPRGTRGLNTSGRDALYTLTSPARFAEEANAAQLVAIQIETRGALDQVDEIAAIDDVDLLFVGPSDLSMSLGVVGQFHHEHVWEAITRVARACQARGKPWGAVLPDAPFARRAADLGCRVLSFGNDMFMLRRGVEAVKAAFGEHFGA